MCEAESKKSVLFIATVAAFLPAFINSAINVALPPLGVEFGMDAVLLGWVVTAHLLAMAVFMVPLGRAADIWGRKRFFTLGMAIYTIFSLFCAFPPSGSVLILFRFFQGMGSSMIFGTSVALLTSVFPPGERGRALGINVTAVYLGLSLGPFLGGVLTQYLGWRSIFFVNVPLGACVVLLTVQKLKGEWIEAAGERFDLFGSVIYGLALVSTIYGLTSLPSSAGAAYLLLGIAGVITFGVVELRSNSPVLDVRLFRENRVFALSNLAALINYGATFAVAFVLTLYLQTVKGLSPLQAGFILVAQPAVQTVLSPWAGKLSDRIEAQVVASVGMGITALGLLLLAYSIDYDTSLPSIVAVLGLLGLGFAFFSSPNTNAIMSSVEKRYYGVASGMVGTMRSIGMMTSMAIAMTSLSIFMGRVQVTPEVYPQFLESMTSILSVFVILCIVGVFASLSRGKVRKAE
ncbi:MAG: MFS transporter [Methanothrix sp.]|jgi:EmrB/QacA subfamily drug resistance transporter|uniref:Efflux pump antibiotic resistance protein n=1 Tax=Methanothrix harundinacea TaxID=301375 RepID=A0A101IK11_9EURY|nr:MAG: MFS transporter [Methanosaeta sp. SDB]KUK44995.1 MAG: Efflux pump antibiotic resistance protein [Methanothrix harundinacea]MDD2638562.1 MFS transporter [Methanothrix sp.]MDI9400107.1 MFS transporter [Euryarchaeota archaeon]KUK96683.1 MAG: Efflux pump antibiotic resistance protein [Methanothrix harundinacea]